MIEINHLVETSLGSVIAFVSTTNYQAIILRSTDQFTSWSIVHTWASPISVNDGQFGTADGKNLFFSFWADNHYESTQYLVSTNDGVQWNTLQPAPKQNYILAAGTALFALGNEGSLSVSVSPKGNSWFQATRGIHAKFSNVFNARPTTRFAIETIGGELYVSSTGASWQPVNANTLVHNVGHSHLQGALWVANTPSGNFTVSNDLKTWVDYPAPAVPRFAGASWNISGFACHYENCVAGVNDFHAFRQISYIFYSPDPRTTDWVAASVPFQGETSLRIENVVAGNTAYVALVQVGLYYQLSSPGLNPVFAWVWVGPKVEITKLRGDCRLKFVGPQNGDGFFVFWCPYDGIAFSSTNGLSWFPFEATTLEILGISYVDTPKGGAYIASSFGSFVNSTTSLRTWGEQYKAPTANAFYDFVVSDAASESTLFASSGDNSIFVQGL